MSMTLEEAIASYEKSAERYHKSFLHCKAHGGEFYQSEAESNKICYEHDRQLAEWLRELQERRKAPEIVRCEDCKWWTKQKDSAQGRCRLLGIYPTGAWYCGNAERKTE